MGEADEWKTRLCKYATYHCRDREEGWVRVIIMDNFHCTASYVLVIHPFIRSVVFCCWITLSIFRRPKWGAKSEASLDSLCAIKFRIVRPWYCHPTHCLRLPYFVTSLLQCLGSSLAPHFSRWRCKFCLSALALRPLWIHGVFVALSRPSSDEVEAPTLSDCYKFPCPAYSDTFGTMEKCNILWKVIRDTQKCHSTRTASL